MFNNLLHFKSNKCFIVSHTNVSKKKGKRNLKFIFNNFKLQKERWMVLIIILMNQNEMKEIKKTTTTTTNREQIKMK